MTPIQVYAIFNLATSICEFSIASFTFASQRPSPQKRVLAWWMCSLGIWSLGVSMHALTNHAFALALFWSRFLHVGAILIPVIYLHFVMVFTGKRFNAGLATLYGASAIFLILLPTKLMIRGLEPIGPFSYFPQAGPVYVLFVLQFCSCIIISLVLLGKKLIQSTGYEYKQVLFIFVGSMIAYATGPTAFLYEYGIPVFPFGTPLVLLNSLVIAYAILKHRLMDISVIVRKTLIYSTVMGSLTIIYLSVVALFAHMFEGFTGYQTIFSSAVAACLITLGFQPLRKRVQAFVDGKFFRQYVDREEKLYELSREVVTHTTPEAMGDALMRVLQDTLHPKSGALYLKSKIGSGYTRYALTGLNETPTEIDDENALVKYFLDHPQPFVHDLPTSVGESQNTRAERSRGAAA